MNRCLAIAVAGALCAGAGCTMSQLAPDEDVVVTGVVVDDTGQPQSRQTVMLVKEPDVGEVLAGVLLGPLTVLNCLSDDPAPICQRARRDRTQPNGRFGFALTGRDTQGSIGQASTFNLASGRSPRAGQLAGAEAGFRFLINEPVVTTPQLELWDPDLGVEADPEAITAPGAAGATLSFENARRSELWSVEDYGGEPIDPRVLEDATASVIASREFRITTDSGRFDLYQRSGAVELVGTAGAPPSRGAACSVDGPGGEPVALAPCPLTDGALTSAYVPDDDSDCEDDGETDDCDDADRWVEVDLGAPRPVSLIVARGQFWDCAVEVSADGTAWTTVGDAHTRSFAVDAGGLAVRYVRLAAASPTGTIVGVTELSVW